MSPPQGKLWGVLCPLCSGLVPCRSERDQAWELGKKPNPPDLCEKRQPVTDRRKKHEPLKGNRAGKGKRTGEAWSGKGVLGELEVGKKTEGSGMPSRALPLDNASVLLPFSSPPLTSHFIPPFTSCTSLREELSHRPLLVSEVGRIIHCHFTIEGTKTQSSYVTRPSAYRGARIWIHTSGSPWLDLSHKTTSRAHVFQLPFLTNRGQILNSANSWVALWRQFRGYHTKKFLKCFLKYDRANFQNSFSYC